MKNCDQNKLNLKIIGIKKTLDLKIEEEARAHIFLQEIEKQIEKKRKKNEQQNSSKKK